VFECLTPAATVPASAAAISGRLAKLVSPGIGLESTRAAPRPFTTTTRPPVSAWYRSAIARSPGTDASDPPSRTPSESDATVTASRSTFDSRSRRSLRS
jgi:hypothetical protein